MTITKNGELASFYAVNKAPIKHLRVYFSPKQAGSGDPSPENVREISGWDGIEVTQCGRNLLNSDNLIIDKWIDSAGAIQTAGAARLSNYIPINGKCTFSGVKTGSSGLRLLLYDENKNFIRREVKTGGNNGERQIITINDNNIKYVRTSTFTNSNPTDTLFLENNLEATEYEPYQGQTYSLNWSSSLGTIYGGYVDLISGLLTVTHQNKVFNGNESENWNVEDWNNIKNFYILVPDANIKQYTSLYCNRIPSPTSQALQPGTCIISKTKNLNLAVGTLLNISTVEELRAWLSQNNTQIVYSLETPITHQLTPQQLETFLGRNNIWSNADRVEIEYDLAESNDILYRRRNTIQREYPHIVAPAASQLINFNTDMVAPLKECKIYFNPIQEGSGDPSPDNVREIVGQNNIQIFQSKKNLYANGDQIVTTTSPFIYKSLVNPLLPGTYTFSAVITSTDTNADTCLIRFFKEDGKNPNTTGPDIIQYQILRSTNNSRVSFTFTINDTAYWIYLYASNTYNNGKNDTAQFTDIMIEAADTMTEYEPYNGQTITISFPSIIYGGYIDLIKGELVATCKRITLSGQGGSWIWNCYTIGIDNINVADGNGGYNILACSHTNYRGYGAEPYYSSVDNIISISQGKQIRYRDNSKFTDLESAQTYIQAQADAGTPVQLVAKLATPIIYTIDHISLKTLRGINNIWSTANGNIEIQYYTH